MAAISLPSSPSNNPCVSNISQKVSSFSVITRSMVNRKLSQVPKLAADNRLDMMTRVIRTRSHLVGQSQNPLHVPNRAGISMFPTSSDPILAPSLTAPLQLAADTPQTSPFKDPTKQAAQLAYLCTPPIHSSRNTSASHSPLKSNPHINPLIFDTPLSSQNSPDASPSTVCTSLPSVNVSNKRPPSSLENHGDLPIQDDDLPLDPLDLDLLENASMDPQPSGMIEMQPQDSVYARSFLVSFNIWQRVLPEEAPSSKKRKPPGGQRPSKMKTPAPKYENYKPNLPQKLTITNPNIAFVHFKLKLFEACDKKLPGVSKSLMNAWYGQNVDIQGFINGTRKVKAIKMGIEDSDSLKDFMDATQLVPATTPMGFKIHHENPKVTENAFRFMENARIRSPPPDPDHAGDSDGELSDAGSAGSAILSAGERNNRTLMKRFAQDFKRGENVTSVTNPKNPDEIILLNTARIRTWANNWADGVPGVDEVNPPTKRPGFQWFPVAEYENQKNRLLGLSSTAPAVTAPGTGTVVHHNYYGHQFPSAGFANNPALGAPFGPPPVAFPAPSGPQVAPAEQLRLSPPPQTPPFEDFLNFAGITPDMKKTRDILAEEGIDSFSRLLDRKTYSFENLRSMKIPFAHADDLWKAVPKFHDHLKSIQNAR